jgi:O-antigen/teichoic acid export membrane protein
MTLAANARTPLAPIDQSSNKSRTRYRRIAAAALSALFGKGAALLVNAITVPLTVRYLGSEGFGLWIAISSAVTMFFVLDIGIANTLTNLISEAYAADDKELAATYFATAFWLVVGIAGLVGVVGWILWPHLDWSYLFHVRDPNLAHETSLAVAAAFVVFLFALPTSLASKVLGGYQELHAANLFAAGGSLASLLGVLAVLHVRGGLPMLVAVYAGSTAGANAICLLWICFFHKPWMKPWPSHIRWNCVGSIFQSGGQFFLIQMAGLVVFNTDNLVIAHYLSPAQVTPYNVTWRLTSYITAVQALISPALWPAYSEAYQKGDLAWIRSAYARNRWVTIVVLAAGCWLLLGAGRRIIGLWAGPAAVPTFGLLSLMCVWMIILSFTLNQSCLMGATYRVGKQAIIGPLASTVNLILSILWVKSMGTIGVLWATVASYLVFVVFVQVWEVRRILRGDFLVTAN